MPTRRHGRRATRSPGLPARSCTSTSARRTTGISDTWLGNRGRKGGRGRRGWMGRMMATVLGLVVTLAARAPGRIDLAHGTERERRTKDTLERLLGTYDLKKYTFTKRVVIEERAINHAFPVLTLNVRFASSPDELLSTYIHEQLHWHLRDLDSRQR